MLFTIGLIVAVIVIIGAIVLLITALTPDPRTGKANWKIWKRDRIGVEAWHFLQLDKKLQFDDGREVVEGKALSMKGFNKPACCIRGMHASEDILHAIGYAPGPVLCRVRVTGALHFGGDKLSGKRRQCLKMYGDARPMFLKAAMAALADEIKGTGLENMDTAVETFRVGQSLLDSNENGHPRDMLPRVPDQRFRFLRKMMLAFDNSDMQSDFMTELQSFLDELNSWDSCGRAKYNGREVFLQSLQDQGVTGVL